MQTISGIIDNITWAFRESGSFLYTAITSPPKEVWGLIALLTSLACLGIYLNRRWVEAKPNEWLLVIRSGKLAKAGVGLKTFTGPLDTIVTFPSKVERVYFQANNVTVQMQGVNIAGFAFWSVYREDDGPFRCYKYMQGLDPNSSVRALCQSVLRNLIANSSLDEVMKNRTHLRVNMQKDLKDQFKGWGIWLESVQITEVRICSSRLFQDLQAQYRQETNLKAEIVKLQGNWKQEESKQNSDLRMSQKKELNDTTRTQTTYKQKLKRKQQQEEYQQKNHYLQVQELKRACEFECQKYKNEHEKNIEKLNNDQDIQEKQQDFEIEIARKALEIDMLHDQTTMKKYKIDSTQRIYSTISVKDIKVNQFNSNTSLLGLIPTLDVSRK